MRTRTSVVAWVGVLLAASNALAAMTWSSSVDFPPIRYDIRSTFGGRLVAGTVAIGDADGGAAAAWDTTVLTDGWNPCISGANATDLYVLNNADCVIEEGRLAASATWGADVTHIVRHWVVIPSGKTLTIEAGTVVKFCPESGIRIEDGGKLLILSDAEHETVLASVADEAWGAVLADTGVDDATTGRIEFQTSQAQLVEMGGHVRLFNVSMPQIPTVAVQSTTAVRNGGMAYVPFVLSGATRTNAFSVDWEAVDGTAVYGDDYLLATGTVTWANSSAGTKTVQIPLNTAHVTGEKTTFSVRLVAAHSAYLSATASTGTVTITERNTLEMTWSGAEASAPLRYDTRTSFSGHLVTGTEPLGEPGGEAVTPWDTTAVANGWTDIEAADASASTSLYVFNDPSVTVEGGRLAETSTWSAETTHLLRHWVVIPRGVTLNVTAGTVVKFCPDTGIRIEDGGRLSVIGEDGNDVIFTSVNDDTAGVAIPGTEVEGTPGRIVLQTSSAQFYDNGFLQMRISYSAYPSVSVQDSTAFRSMGVAYVLFTVGGTTRNERFSVDWRAVDGTATYGEDYLLATGTVTWAKSGDGTKTVAIPLNATNVAGEIRSFSIQIVTNRSVNVADGLANIEIRELDFLPMAWGDGIAETARYDTRTNFGGTLVTAVQPIGEPDGSALDRWNTAELDNGWHEVRASSTSATADLYVLNDPDIAIEGGRVPAGTTTWASNVTHLVRHDIVIPSGATLNLAAGAVIKFCPGTRIYIQDGGTLNIAGAADANVVFTGINDDEAGKEVVGTGIDPALRIGAIVKQSSSAKITDTGYLQVQNINAVAGYPSIRLNDAVADRANGFAWIPVTLSGDSRSTRFDIDWETVDGTAQFGTDYLMATGHIDWASTSQGTKWIQLPLDTTPTGERRQFQVRIKTARAANIVGKYAYVDIYELDSAKVESFDVRLWTNTVDEAECAIDTEIVETPWIDDDVLDIRYSPTWQDEVPAGDAYAEVSLETDDGVTLLARGEPGESGYVALDMNTIPYGVYTLRHKIFDADGTLLAAYLKDFLFLDPDSAEVHFGPLTANETWHADKVHVVYGTVSVPAIYTLFFEPGAIVKFFTGASIRLDSGAALFANGVVFTHVNDDTVGGDTCFDGFAKQPVLDSYTLTGSVTLGQDCDLRYITIKTSIPASITSDYTLYRGAIYEVTNNVTVQNGATLTIHPGTILKFSTNTALNVASGGRLSAIGSRAAPIIFTSIRDDEHGGDSNHDGDATAPQPGDWVKISTSGSAEAILRHCQILYSSRNSTTGAINMNGGTVEFTDSMIAHGLYDGVGVESGNFYMTNSVIWDCLTAFRHWPRDPIANSVIYDCGRLTQGGDQHFVNCIFSKITDTWEAFGFPRSTYTNCVFWNEEGSILTGEGTQDAMTVCGQNGNIWGDPLFVDPEHADFRIRPGSPCVDAADSFAAPAADHFGQPRFTFASSEQAGIPDESGTYADIGLCEVQLRAVTSGHDLSAVAVKTVGDIRPGNPLCVQWVVANDGEETLEENWRDSLSLVSEKGDIVELGEKLHFGSIQAGGEYNAMDWFAVPALAEGNWRARLVANAYRDVYEGALTNNNEAFSATTYPVAATVVPASGGTFAVPAGATVFLRVTGLSTNGGILSFASDRIQDLSVSRAFPSAEWPWTWRLDSALAGSLVIPSVSATNSVYLFVRNEGAFPTDVSTSLDPIVPAIDEFTPSTLPAAFPAVLHLSGTGLDRIESVSLYDGSTCVATSTDVAHTSSVDAAATFDLSQVPPGSICSVSAVIDGIPVAAPGTLTVAQAVADGEMTAWLEMPPAVRDGRVFIGYVHYRNTGAADILAPVFKLHAEEYTTLLAKRRSDEFLPAPLYLVGASPTFPQFVLKVGEETSIPFYFTMRDHYHLILERLTTDTEINPRDFVARWWQREQAKLSIAAELAANEAMRQESLPSLIEKYLEDMFGPDTSAITGYSIRGTATFADGTAAAHETLALYYDSGEYGALQETVTGADGGFAFAELDSDTNYCIQGVTVTVANRDTIAIDGADVSGVAVEVAPLGSVRGVVRNAADTNQVYAGLKVFAQDGYNFVRETVTDENGGYVFHGLNFGEIAIQTDVPDGMAFGYAETRLDRDNLIAQVDFALVPGVDVTGTLYVDGTTTPVTNAMLNLHDAGTRLWTGTAITGDDGRFEFKAVPANSTALVSVAESDWILVDSSTNLAIGAESMETDFFVAEPPLFHAFPASGSVPLSVGFFLRDPGLTNQAASFAWDFDGDGETDSDYADPLVRFTTPGTNDVTLVVTYTNGLVVTSRVEACVITHEPLPTVYQPGVLVLLDGDEANSGDWAIDGYDGDSHILRLTALSSGPAITPAEGTPIVFKDENGRFCWQRVTSVSSAGDTWTLGTTNVDRLSEIYYSFEYSTSSLDESESSGNTPAPARRGGPVARQQVRPGNSGVRSSDTRKVGPVSVTLHQQLNYSIGYRVDGRYGQDGRSINGRLTTTFNSHVSGQGGLTAGFHETYTVPFDPIDIGNGTTFTPYFNVSVAADAYGNVSANCSASSTSTTTFSLDDSGGTISGSSHFSSSCGLGGEAGLYSGVGFEAGMLLTDRLFDLHVFARGGMDFTVGGNYTGNEFTGKGKSDLYLQTGVTGNLDGLVQYLSDAASKGFEKFFNWIKPDDSDVTIDDDVYEKTKKKWEECNSENGYCKQIQDKGKETIDKARDAHNKIRDTIKKTRSNYRQAASGTRSKRAGVTRQQTRGAEGAEEMPGKVLSVLSPVGNDSAQQLGNGMSAFSQGVRLVEDALVSRTVDYGDGTVETFTAAPAAQDSSGDEDQGEATVGIPDEIVHDYTRQGRYTVTVQDQYEYFSPPPRRFVVEVEDLDIGDFDFPTMWLYEALPLLGTNFQVGVSDPWATNAATPLSAAYCLIVGIPPDPSIYDPTTASPSARALRRGSGPRDSDGDGISDLDELKDCDDPTDPDDPEDEPDDENPTEEEDEEEDDSVKSTDPNEVSGPDGYGDFETERCVWAGLELPYTIYFENKADARADAQEVRIDLPLDPAFDWESFAAGTVVAGATVDDGLDGRQCATSQVHHAASGFDLRSSIVLDTENGKATWYLRVVDTNTFDGWPQDTYSGFLPPNDETGRGEGYVTFHIKVRDGVEYGTRVSVAASIVFDYNEAIATDPSWWNTVSAPWYAVTFADEDGSVLKKATYYPEGTAAGDIVQPDEPTKAADVQWTYEFAGWEPELAEVTADATYVATYGAELRKYDVTFAWHDGAVVAPYPYGTAASDVAVPANPPDYYADGMIYSFAGWSPAEVADVTGEATYEATYDEAPAIAQIIGGDYYPSLASAVAAAEDGDTVLLLADQTLDARVEPNTGADSSLTIDLGGFKVTREGTGGNGSVFDVKSGNVVITNGVIDCTQDDAAIVADGVYAITVRSGANVTLADLDVTVDSKNGACAYPFAGATLAIESGTYANITDQPYQYKEGWMGMAVNQANVAETLITITGGSFSQVDPALGDDSAAEGTMSFVDDDYVTVLEDGAYVVYEAVTVTFVTDKGDVPEAQRIGKGKTATEPDPAPECENWAFNYWTLEGAEYDFSTAVMEDIELVADWTLTHQTVTFDPSPYGTFRGEPTLEMTFEIGGTYHDLPGTTPDGTHARLGWFTKPDGEGGEPVEEGDDVTGGATLTLYAHWTDKQTLTFDAQNGAEPTTAVYAIGGTYGTLPKPTWAGHAFLGWFTEAADGKKLSATSIVTTRPTRTMYAHWTTEQTVIFDAQGGACDPSTMVAEMGGRYGSLPKPTKAGYTFVGWYTLAEGGNHLTASSIVTTLKTRTFYAHWTNDQTVNFDAQGGACEPATMVAEMGGRYGALPKSTKAGYAFVGWYTKAEGGNHLTANSIVTTLKTRTFYAHWTNEQTVTFDAQGGTCDPKTLVATVGEPYGVLPVPEKEGQKFLGWYTKTEGGSKVSAASVVTAVTKRTLYAHWKEGAGTLSISGFSRSARAGVVARDAKFDADEYLLVFVTEAGVTYEVQWTSALGREWVVLKSWTAVEDGETAVTVSVPAASPTGFFRVVEVDAE